MSEYRVSYDIYHIILQGRVKTVRVIAMKKCFHMECYRCEVRVWGETLVGSIATWTVTAVVFSCSDLALFPGHRRNSLATSVGSNCYFCCLKVGSTIQTSECSHMAIAKPNCIMQFSPFTIAL